MPVPDAAAPITIDGESAEHWQQGAVEAWVIQRGVIRQDGFTARADEAVLWIDRAPQASQEDSRVTVYLEGSAAVDFGRAGQVHANTGAAAQSIRDHSWFGRLTTHGGVDVRAPVRTDVQSVKPAVYQRAEQTWEQAVSGVRQAVFTTQPPLLPPPSMPSPSLQAPSLQAPGLPSQQPLVSAPTARRHCSPPHSRGRSRPCRRLPWLPSPRRKNACRLARAAMP